MFYIWKLKYTPKSRFFFKSLFIDVRRFGLSITSSSIPSFLMRGGEIKLGILNNLGDVPDRSPSHKSVISHV